MAKKRNRITAEMSKTIAESSPLIKSVKTSTFEDHSNSIIEVDLDALNINPYQPRIDINLQSLNELISSIEQNGLLQPIVITESKNGKHTIVAGHRRYEAFKIMGKDKIKASVLKDIEDKDLAILSLTENLMRENLHPIENAIAIKNILDNNIVESQNKLAEYVGLSKGYVSKLMNILKLPSSVIKTIKDENYKDINILVLLNKISDELLMLEAYEAVKNLSRHDAEKYIKNKYFNSEKKGTSLIDIKTSNTKMNIHINFKNLSDDQISLIQDKVKTLNNELTSLYNEWIK